MTTVLKVEEMTCGHCKATVEEALLQVQGVESATVDLDAGSAAVEHAGVSDQELADAVTSAGYIVAGVGK